MVPLSALLLLATPAAWPCGGFFHDGSEHAHSDTQLVLFDRTASGITTVNYAVSYAGNATSFGWVIPVPGEFQDLLDGNMDDFTSLLDQTNPIVFREDLSSGSCMACGTDRSLSKGGIDSGFSDTGEGGRGVSVIATGMSASYSFTVLEASSEDALLGWLDENGWDVAESGPSIAAYVSEGGWQFVAISLLPATDSAGAILPPVSITYSGEQVVYPARMGRYNMVDELHTIVFVRAETPMTVSAGWSVEPVGELAGTMDDYEGDVYDERLRALGGDAPGYGLAYSDADGNGWLTRFDSMTTPDANTADATFTASDDETYVRATVTLSEDGDRTNPAPALLLPLALAGWLARRRS